MLIASFPVTTDVVPTLENKSFLHTNIFKGGYSDLKHLKKCKVTDCKIKHLKIVINECQHTKKTENGTKYKRLL